jgi:hypothetical protein
VSVITDSRPTDSRHQYRIKDASASPTPTQGANAPKLAEQQNAGYCIQRGLSQAIWATATEVDQQGQIRAAQLPDQTAAQLACWHSSGKGEQVGQNRSEYDSDNSMPSLVADSDSDDTTDDGQAPITLINQTRPRLDRPTTLHFDGFSDPQSPEARWLAAMMTQCNSPTPRATQQSAMEPARSATALSPDQPGSQHHRVEVTLSAVLRPFDQLRVQPGTDSMVQPAVRFEQPAANPTEQEATQPAVDAWSKPAMQPAEHPVEQRQQSVMEPVRSAAALSPDQPGEELAPSAVGQPSNQQVVQPSIDSIDQPLVQPAANPTKHAAAQPAVDPLNKLTKQLAEHPVEQPIGYDQLVWNQLACDRQKLQLLAQQQQCQAQATEQQRLSSQQQWEQLSQQYTTQQQQWHHGYQRCTANTAAPATVNAATLQPSTAVV